MNSARAPSRPRPVGALALALVACLAAGCGSGHSVSRTSSSRLPAGVRFSGGAVPWTLWANAGPNPYTADLYRIAGTLSRARRITSSPPGAGISLVTAVQGRVIVSHPRFQGDVDQVEQLDLSRPGALPGRWITTGQGPVLSPGGKLAYVVPYWHNDSGDDLIVRDRIDAPERRVFREPDYKDALGPDPTWGPHDLLVVTAGRERSPEIVVDPGPRERKLAGPVGMSDALFTPSGELSYQAGDRLVLRALNGRVIRTTSMHGWQLRCWTPDGRLLVATGSTTVRGGKLGLLDPRTDLVTVIGAYSDGFLYQVICPNGSS